MNEIRYTGPRRNSERWWPAVIRGVVTCLVLATILSVLARVFIPSIDYEPSLVGDPAPWPSQNMIGVGIWALSIGISAFEAYWHRRKGK